MLISFSGQEYEYDPAAIDVPTAIAIRDHTGMGMRSWEKAIDDADPVALQALFWVIKRQNGENVPLKTLNFAINEFYAAIRDASVKELVDKLAALVSVGEATPKQERALAVLTGEAELEPGEKLDPTETAT